MILRRHVPGPALAQYIEFFWYFEDWQGAHTRERVLPDASFELVINLQERPRKLFDRERPERFTNFRRGWLSGAHSKYIVIDAVLGASMIGVHFRPGGIRPFIEQGAAEFQDHVIEFDAVWGAGSHQLRERILAAPNPSAKFRHLEEFLAGKLARARCDENRRKGMAWASQVLSQGMDVRSIGALAAAMGISHKHFIEQFRYELGLNPKAFCRIRRFQQVLTALHSGKPVRWAEVACACGYYDQSHLVREFQAFAGINPSDYRSLDADHASFVPVEEVR